MTEDAAATGPAGMPPLVLGDRPLSFFEFWPGWAFYAPVALAILGFIIRFRGATLPTVTNPSFSGGGFAGESKSQILTHARRHLGDLVAPFITYTRRPGDVALEAARVLNLLADAGLDFPLVAKPDMACRGAGVQPLYGPEDLKRYLRLFPVNAELILQRMIRSEGEAGIFYVREPHEAQGRIISITLKYFPYVAGDGVRTLRQLIEGDPRANALSSIYLPRFRDRLNSTPKAGERVRLAFAGNHSKGTIFRNGNALITPQLTALFDQLSQKIPGFFFGRYDIRFDDFRRIQAGEPAFAILEINGSGAESTHIWDARTGLLAAWRDVIYQFYLVWKIGAANRRQGAKPMSVLALWRAFRREKELTQFYPPTL
jgi:hypothetical protein